LTRYGSDLTIAQTVHKNWISSVSDGAAFTSPHDFISLYQNIDIHIIPDFPKINTLYLF
jgi:hypothetical protein